MRRQRLREKVAESFWDGRSVYATLSSPAPVDLWAVLVAAAHNKTQPKPPRRFHYRNDAMDDFDQAMIRAERQARQRRKK